MGQTSDERRLELTPEFTEDVGCWRWFVNQEKWRIEKMADRSSRQWFSDVSYKTVGGYCLETGWWWRYGLSEEDSRWTVRIRARVGYGSFSINVLELFGMVWTMYVICLLYTSPSPRDS